MQVKVSPFRVVLLALLTVGLIASSTMHGQSQRREPTKIHLTTEPPATLDLSAGDRKGTFQLIIPENARKEHYRIGFEALPPGVRIAFTPNPKINGNNTGPVEPKAVKTYALTKDLEFEVDASAARGASHTLAISYVEPNNRQGMKLIKLRDATAAPAPVSLRVEPQALQLGVGGPDKPGPWTAFTLTVHEQPLGGDTTWVARFGFDEAVFKLQQSGGGPVAKDQPVSFSTSLPLKMQLSVKSGRGDQGGQALLTIQAHPSGDAHSILTETVGVLWEAGAPPPPTGAVARQPSGAHHGDDKTSLSAEAIGVILIFVVGIAVISLALYLSYRSRHSRRRSRSRKSSSAHGVGGRNRGQGHRETFSSINAQYPPLEDEHPSPSRMQRFGERWWDKVKNLCGMGKQEGVEEPFGEALPSPVATAARPEEVPVPTPVLRDAMPEPHTGKDSAGEQEGQTHAEWLQWSTEIEGVLQNHYDVLAALQRRIAHLEEMGHASQRTQQEMHAQSAGYETSITRVQNVIANIRNDLEQLRAEHSQALQEQQNMLDRTQKGIASLDSLVRRMAYESYEIEYKQMLSQLLRTVSQDNIQLRDASKALVDQFFANRPLNADDYREMEQLQSRLSRLIDALTTIQRATEDLGGATHRIIMVHEKSSQILQEFDNYERHSPDKRVELTVPVSLDTTDPQTIFDEMAWAIRMGTRKLRDPFGYFTEKVDRLIIEDLVAVVDICDGIRDKEQRQLEKYIRRLLNEALLEDISPQVGTAFDPRSQTPIDQTDAVRRNVIYKVERRGFRYKERDIRQANVVIGK